jgi:glutaconate CoA-transferase subunit B
MTALSEERTAILLARELRDGWVAVVGARSNVPLAACLLAQRSHAPRLTVIAGGIYVNPARLVPHFAAGLDCRPEAVGDVIDIYQLTEAGVDVMFYSGLQIDRFGSVNLHWVARPSGRFRGPGLANTSFGHTAGRTMLWTERHDARTLVPEVDFVSVMGHRYAGRSRAELGITTAGPTRLFTPSMVFAADGGEFRPHSVHAGNDWPDVRQRTGWQLPECPPPPSEEPTADEVDLLRRAVDPEGLLRRQRS